MLALATALLLAGTAKEYDCAALTANRSTPIRVGRITLDSSPAGSTDAAAALQFNNRRIIVRQPADVIGLSITLQTGSVGPVDVVETDAAGKVVRTSMLRTIAPQHGSMNYQLVTARATTITLKSRNNEGAVLAICEIE